MRFALEWSGITLAAISATLFAQAAPPPEPPTSVTVAFITVSMSAVGLLGWVLREQTQTLRAYSAELAKVRLLLSRIAQQLDLEEEESKEP